MGGFEAREGLEKHRQYKFEISVKRVRILCFAIHGVLMVRRNAKVRRDEGQKNLLRVVT